MALKLLQLNIQKGRFVDRVIEYIKKERFDIVTLQEVTGQKASYEEKVEK